MVISADLGSSSNYSNELLDKTLKTVVEKVFLRVALMQESVGPNCLEKSDIL